MQRLSALWSSGARGKIVVLISAALLSCIVCAVFGALSPRSTPTQTAAQPGAAAPVAQPTQAQAAKPAEAKPTNPPKPTDPPKPTATTKPTDPPRPTATPVLGQGREAPIPKGQPATSKSGWGIVIGDFMPDANAAIANANMFNKKPDAGKKWVIVAVGAKYMGSVETGRLGPGNFRLVGKKGTIYNAAFVVLPNALQQTEVFKDGETSGLIPYEVAADDSDFRVIVNAFLGEGIYMAVE